MTGPFSFGTRGCGANTLSCIAGAETLYSLIRLGAPAHRHDPNVPKRYWVNLNARAEAVELLVTVCNKSRGKFTFNVSSSGAKLRRRRRRFDRDALCALLQDGGVMHAEVFKAD